MNVRLSNKSIIYPLVLAFLLLAFGFPSSLSADTQQSNVRIAVRAHSGNEIAIKKWSATADYLSKAIEGYSFTMLPIVEFDEMRKIVDNQEVEFILTNPAAYIDLEINHGATRIVTLINRRGKDSTDKFSSVIFTRSNRKEIKGLDDIRGRSIMGVHREAFGGWWMALGELKKNGIEPDRDCSEVLFGGEQESVVFAIRDGKADVGTVRTGIMERLAQIGEIDLNDFKILGRKDDGFVLPHSSSLYPEWPLARLKNTPHSLAQKVAIALLEMEPDNEAALAGNYTSWTVPLDYTSIHDLLKKLRVGPYKEYGKVTFKDTIKKYWYWIALIIIGGLASILTTAYVTRINKQLNLAQSKLKREIEVREKLISKLQKALNEIKTLRGILPICSYCKNIRNDKGYYEQIEGYIHKHSGVDFSHTICPTCLKEHYPEDYTSFYSGKNKE